MLKRIITAIIIISFILGAYFVYIDSIEKNRLKEDMNFIVSTLSNENEDWDIKEKALLALADIGKPAIKPLIGLLNDKDYALRRGAAFALGELRHKSAVIPLAAVLNDGDKRVRYNAVMALGKIGDKRSIGPLIVALKDESPSVRIEAARILGEIGGKSAIESLITLMKDENWGVREEGYVALKKITHQDLGWDYRKWLEWWQNQKKLQ